MKNKSSAERLFKRKKSRGAELLLQFNFVKVNVKRFNLSFYMHNCLRFLKVL